MRRSARSSERSLTARRSNLLAVADIQVAAYSGLVKHLAHKLAGYSGAEFDDLRQEGLVAVFLSLRAGALPSERVIRGRMLNWCRYLRRLENNDAIAYEKLLPMEHYAIDEL